MVGENGFGAYTLPFKDAIIIGRSHTNDVSIDDASISRRHAVIHFAEGVSIEDLGSRNGTRVREPVQWIPEVAPAVVAARERRLAAGERAELVPGSIIKLGSLMLMFQAHVARRRSQTVLPRVMFEELVRQECARVTRDGGEMFAIVHARVESPARYKFAVDTADVDVRTLHQSGVATDAKEAILGSVMRPGDVLAVDEYGNYDVLLARATPRDAARVVAALVDAFSQRSFVARVGHACYPRDGRSHEALLARARGEELAAPDLPAVPSIVVRDPRMIALHERIDLVAGSDLTVLLLGETGVGKDVIADAIHCRSLRAAGPMVRLNCAALPETLLEGELFGHERGAFTGADQARAGFIESAHGGTLFLDEVGEMPRTLQVKLLRVLEERRVMRLGARTARDVDIRIVAATNRDLEQEVAKGRFREDLYFRINAFPLLIPPLRERRSEIEPLANAFLAALSAQMHRPVPRLAPTAIETLRAHSWPGNVRELRNVIHRALVLCRGEVITDLMLAGDSSMRAHARAPTLPLPEPARAPDLRASVERVERDQIVAALEQCSGNQTRAAKLLGVTRKVLLSRLGRYGIPRPRSPSGSRS